jgi:hypothetical protein
LGREERGAGTGVVGDFPIDPVRTIIEVAKLLSIGEHTFRTMLREGRGPTVTTDLLISLNLASLFT